MSVGGVNNGFNIDPSYKKDTTNVNVNKNIGKTEDIKKTLDVIPSYSKNNDVKINPSLSGAKGLDKELKFNFVDKQQASPARDTLATFSKSIDVIKGGLEYRAKEKMLPFFESLFNKPVEIK